MRGFQSFDSAHSRLIWREDAFRFYHTVGGKYAFHETCVPSSRIVTSESTSFGFFGMPTGVAVDMPASVTDLFIGFHNMTLPLGDVWFSNGSMSGVHRFAHGKCKDRSDHAKYLLLSDVALVRIFVKHAIQLPPRRIC